MEHAHFVARVLSRFEFGSKFRELGCLDRSFVELEPRERVSALMLQIGALEQGLRKLGICRKDFFASELRVERPPRLEGLSGLVSQFARKKLLEDWRASERLGGACPPGGAQLRCDEVLGRCADVSLQLVSRALLAALPGEKHLESHEDFVETLGRHAPIPLRGSW